MRTIKFRMWHNSKMYNVTTLGIDNEGIELGMCFSHPKNNDQIRYGEAVMFHGESKLMQFTGLHDKNGKEIYEGDIVKYYQSYAKTWHIHSVKWDGAFAAFGLFEDRNEFCQESDWMKIQDVEVIGNIHENPELLS